MLLLTNLPVYQSEAIKIFRRGYNTYLLTQGNEKTKLQAVKNCSLEINRNYGPATSRLFSRRVQTFMNSKDV